MKQLSRRRWNLFSVVSLPLILLAVGVLIFASCLPSWMPDSNSFLYVTFDQKVMMYDLKTNKSKQVCELEGAKDPKKSKPAYGEVDSLRYIQPAPDGKKFAISRVEQKSPNKFQLHLDLYSIAGKKLSSSKLIELDADSAFFQTLCWTPDSKTLLVHLLEPQKTIIYNLEKKSHLVAKAGMVFIPAAGVWPDYSTVTPDGKHFFGLEDKEDDVQFHLYSIETGKSVAIVSTEKLELTLRDYFSMDDPLDPEVSLPAYWEDSKLIFPVAKGEVRFDVEKKVASFEKTEMMSMLSEVAQQNGRIVIGRIGENLLIELDDSERDRNNKLKLNLYNLDTEKTTEISNDAQTILVKLLPSPDKKHLLIVPGGMSKSILLDSKGKVVDRIDTRGQNQK